MKDFFYFRSKLFSSTVQAYAVGLIDKENGRNDYLNLIRGNYRGIDFPVIFKQNEGKNWSDLLDTGYPVFYLISHKMKAILEENQLTGWKNYPIKLFDKKGHEILGYYGFSITGRCESINYKSSEIIEKKLVSNGPICKYYKGLTIEKWDGSDFFIPEQTLHMFISKKAMNLLKKNKLTNLHIENIADKETSVDLG